MGDPEAFRGRGRLRLLLDTHAFIWAAEGTLQERARAMIESDADAVFVSAASIWEIEIKRSLNRLGAPEDAVERVDRSGYERLAISLEHACEAGRLPLHHGDPFDRMLIAQARVEGLALATADEALSRYGVSLFPVARA